MLANTSIRKLMLDDCYPGMFLKLNRYQETRAWWQNVNGEWMLLDDELHIDNWNDDEKEAKAQERASCIKEGGVVFGAYIDGDLIGAAHVPLKFCGKNNDYLQLDGLHVSLEHRNKGIGKELLRASCVEAKKMGARKLYISAHPSKETQAFYSAVGCSDVTEIIQDLLEKEPYDRHLEYVL